MLNMYGPSRYILYDLMVCMGEDKSCLCLVKGSIKSLLFVFLTTILISFHKNFYFFTLIFTLFFNNLLF